MRSSFAVCSVLGFGLVAVLLSSCGADFGARRDFGGLADYGIDVLGEPEEVWWVTTPPREGGRLPGPQDPTTLIRVVFRYGSTLAVEDALDVVDGTHADVALLSWYPDELADIADPGDRLAVELALATNGETVGVVRAAPFYMLIDTIAD